MAFRWWNSSRSILPLVVTLAGFLTTIADARTKYIISDENATLPETTSVQGRIRGVNMVTHKNRPIYGFLGIPYAEPPVGDLRFRAPLAAGAWDGTFNASSNPNECPQLIGGTRTYTGNEDCLYIQVYTPKLPRNDNSTLLPVMVFIVGGAFKGGSISVENFGPTFLLDEDVVFVVPAVRVGALGFLTTGDEASPGNYGLKDNVLALKWVRNNIRYFGGDPDQVTLTGGSSGATSVGLLAMADVTDGLFHRCITASGTAFSPELGTSVKVHLNRSMTLAEYFGCPTDSTTLMVNCLRKVDASQLVDTNELFHVWNTLPNMIWLPTIEPDVEGALLKDTFANLVAAGKVRDVPWVNLVVRDEGFDDSIRFYQDGGLFEEFLDKIDFILPYLLGYYAWDDIDAGAFTAALKSYYVNDLAADRSLLLKNVTDMAGDGMFFWPTYQWIQQQLVRAKSPQYLASFQYRGVFSQTYIRTGGNTSYKDAVAHGDEIIYLFEDIERRFGPAYYEYSDADLVMVDTMVQLWTSFVINGTPTIRDWNLSTTIWEPYSPLNNYLRIGNGSDTSIETEYDLHKERMQFWKELTSSCHTASSTPGKFQKRLQFLPISLGFTLLLASLQRRHG